MDSKVLPFTPWRVGIHGIRAPRPRVKNNTCMVYAQIRGEAKILTARISRSCMPAGGHVYPLITSLVQSLSAVFNKIKVSLKEDACTVEVTIPFTLEEPTDTLSIHYMIEILAKAKIPVRALREKRISFG
jgi:hypothetical protein